MAKPNIQCFPMSHRMRQLAERMPNVDIIHRSFALVSEPGDFNRMFGSREQAKGDILSHWRAANVNDDLHRFNIVGMQSTEFSSPTSTNALRAAKAAWLVGGEAAYWDAFDAIQAALFMNSQNIEDHAVIRDAVERSGIDIDAWDVQYESDAAGDAVQHDLAQAARYGLRGVPALIVNGEHIIPGAQPLEVLVQAISQIGEQMPDNGDAYGVCTP